MAGEIRPEHLRHARRPLQAGQARRLHSQGPHGLSARSGVAGGGAATSRPARQDRGEQPSYWRPTQVHQTDAGIEITVPKSDRQEIDTIVMLQLDKPALDVAPIAVSSLGQSLTVGKNATASNVFENAAAYDATMAVDDNDATRWATDAATSHCWLEVDLGKPETFDRARIDECVDFGVRVKAFELQYREGSDWKTFFKGTAIGRNREVKFDPLTARHVRLNIEGEHGPTINEFQLFAPARRKTSP